MERHVVSSSRIHSVGWENNTLEIQFHDGAVYQYHNVSHNEYLGFIQSPSLGHALSILDKQHSYNRI